MESELFCQADLRTTSEFALGNFGEKLWSNVFLGARMAYIPLAKIANGGAPMLEAAEKLILPDFDVSNNRFSVYVDSKAKRRPVLYRHANELRHGVERRHCSHYKEFAARSRRHCCLGIFECFCDESLADWSGCLLLQSLWKLGEPAQGMGSMSTTVFWPRSKFILVGKVTARQAHDIALGREKVSGFAENVAKVLELASEQPVQPLLW